MSEKRFSVQIEKGVEVVGKKPKSACIFDKETMQVYMLAVFSRFDRKKDIQSYIDGLYEVVDLLNELMEKEISIVLEDDFGRAMTSIKTELSPPQLIEKIMELFVDE